MLTRLARLETRKNFSVSSIEFLAVEKCNKQLDRRPEFSLCKKQCQQESVFPVFSLWSLPVINCYRPEEATPLVKLKYPYQISVFTWRPGATVATLHQGWRVSANPPGLHTYIFYFQHSCNTYDTMLGGRQGNNGTYSRPQKEKNNYVAVGIFQFDSSGWFFIGIPSVGSYFNVFLCTM